MVLVDIHLQSNEHWVDQTTLQVLLVLEQMDSTLVFNTSQIGAGSTSFYYQCTNHPNAMYGQIIVKILRKVSSHLVF